MSIEAVTLQTLETRRAYSGAVADLTLWASRHPGGTAAAALRKELDELEQIRDHLHAALRVATLPDVGERREAPSVRYQYQGGI